MKRTKLFAALILVLLSAGSKASAEQTIPIEVIEQTAPSTRDLPGGIPVKCEYHVTQQCLYLRVNAALGNVCVTIENLSGGSSLEDNLNTSPGLLVIPLAGASCSYFITIETSAGGIYYALFNL